MKKEILNRIEALGGDISTVKNISLQKDLEAITFDSVLHPKKKDTPWATSDETEPINGIGGFIDENKDLFDSNKTAFYDKIISQYYRITEESFGQVIFRNTLFTPFQEGTDDYEEWKDFWQEEDFKKVIEGTDMNLMFIGYSYGFPDNLFICLTDPNPENPTVYGTDHTMFFDEITKQGTLEEFFNSFISKQELVDLLKNKLES